MVDLIVPPGYREAVREQMRVLAEGETDVLDRRLRVDALRRCGHEFPAELVIVRAGESSGDYSGYVRDLTELGAAQQRGVSLQRLLFAAEALVEMGSWELDLVSGEAVWSDGLYRMYGYEPGEVDPDPDLLVQGTHPDDRPEVAELMRKVVEEPRSLTEDSISFACRIVHKDGSIREARARGRLERSDSGDPIRWIGVAQDLTEQQQAEDELKAVYTVTQALRDWQTFDEGVLSLLTRIGTALDYPVGSMWVADDDDRSLSCRAFWSAPGVDSAELQAAVRAAAIRRGAGITGTTWETGKPLLIADVATHPTAVAKPEAARVGLRSAVAFPAMADGKPLAVLTFWSFDRRRPSDRLARTLTGIGRELGRFFSARRGLLTPGPLSPRELDVLRLAAEGHAGPQIAEQLFLSPATVKTHFEHIYEKLGIGDRGGAVAEAMRTGLIL